ncbi:MAG: hypothetical protein ACREUT_17460 [Steroidobacteraceae bacterium]
MSENQQQSNSAGAEIREIAPSATDQALMTAITKAEFDQAVIVAHAHRRSVKQFLDECMQLATLNEQIADDCIYALPRKEDGQTKMIEGPSARLAEIVAHAWGNCQIGARVVEEGREFVRAQGIFKDLEKNVHITYEVSRRIVNRYNKRYSADMIGVTGNAACSIALRNAVFKGVPKAFWNPIYEAAQKVCKGDAKTLVNRRSEALAFLQKQGATKEMVLGMLGLKGVEDITLDHLVQLRGIATAIKEGEITVEEAFAPKQEEPMPSRTDAAKEALRQGAPAGAAPKAGDAKSPADSKAQDLGGAIPQYSAEKAIEALRAAKSNKDREKLCKEIVKDFADTNRPLPIDVEAVNTEMREALTERESKL